MKVSGVFTSFDGIKNSNKLLGYDVNIAIFLILLELWIDSSDHSLNINYI